MKRLALLVVLMLPAGAALAQDEGAAPQRASASAQVSATTTQAPSAEALEARLAEAPHDADAAFSLGVVRARAGELGPAILWLERAHRLEPTDRQIEDALTLARAEAHARRNEAAGNAVIVEGAPRGVDRWRFFGGLRRPVYATALLIGLWSLTLGAWRFRSAQGARRDAWAVAASAGAIAALVGGGLWAGSAWTAATVQPAVVLNETPAWRDAPDALARATRDPNLYEGGIVLLVDERDGWRAIELVDGDRGWVRADEVAPVSEAPQAATSRR